MKKTLLLFLGVLMFQLGYTQIRSKVDERFELTSIAFALAGVPSYCQCTIPAYWKDINTDMTPYELTEPINFVRKLHQIHGINYDAVSTTAEMLEIKNGKIRLQSQYDISKISEIDSRWNEELFTKYIKMLNVFYKQSNFHQFFKKHKVLYDLAEQRMDVLLADTTMEWFEDFFGKPLDSNINIWISLCNGSNNYAMPNGVLIGMAADDEGLPNLNNAGTEFMLIHEIGHHYTNPLFDTYWPQMEAAANKMYPYIKDRMTDIAYGSAQTTFGEWLNNLFVLMYIRETDTNPEKYKSSITPEIERGFIWMQHSVDFMGNFYTHRDRYPYIEDFMPQLTAFLNYTADHYDLVIQKYEARKPVITSVYPVVGSDITDVEEIVISFSEPMSTGKWAFYGTGSDDVNVKYLEISDVQWINDGRSVTLILNKELMKETGLYGIQLFPHGFTTLDNVWLNDRCKNLLFKIE